MTPARTVAGLGLVAVVALVATLVSTRAQSQSAPGAAAPGAAAPATAARIVATVDGVAITETELDTAAGTELGRLERELYDLRQKRLDGMIAERLVEKEAAKRKLTVEQLLVAEVQSKLTPVGDDEVERFYEANKARIRETPTIKAQIRDFLQSQQRDSRTQEYVASLRQAANVSVTLAAPPIRRATVPVDGAPVRGEVAAPVTIVEFSDFHCPFCRTVQPTLMKLLEAYPGKVRVVYKDLPLDGLHPNARRASEAARCAGEQQKFWQFHDVLYTGGNDVSDATLQGHAATVGLDATAFTACLASDRHRSSIERDIADAARLGLQSTPAFLVNGRPLAGAQPFEAFKQIIDEELALPR